MKKLIILSSLIFGLHHGVNAQVNSLYNNVYMGNLSNIAMNNLDEKVSVDFVYMTMNQFGQTDNQNLISGRGAYQKMNYGIKASTQSYAGIDQMDVQLNTARSFQLNEKSSVAFGINASYFRRQMETPSNQTQDDSRVDDLLDYDNIYGGFAAAYSYQNLNVGISSGDLFNTSLDQSASWTLQADYTVDILDSVIVLQPQMIINQGYDLDGPIAMFGLDAVLNQFVTTSLGYYTNEAVHLGVGLRYNKLRFDYRYRYFYSSFRENVGGQNSIGLSYQF